MATLYVTEQGARIEKEYRRIVVSRDDQVLLSVPVARVDHVVLVGRVGATTPALLALLDEGVGLSFITRWGKLRGRLSPPTAKNIPLRHQQYRRAEDADFCLALSRAIVAGKLRNYRTLARRILRSRETSSRPADSSSGDDQIHTQTTSLGHSGANAQIERLTNAIRGLDTAASLATVRGLEGSGSKAYFAILRQALHSETRTEMGFERRNRRPPRDPINALLSLGYSLLTHNLMTACEVVGLDPYDGFLHSDKYGRPALALDLVEEFRGVIVDSVLLNLVNRNRVSLHDFESGRNGGIYLKRDALRRYFSVYTQRLNTEILHTPSGRRLTYQKILEVQARQLRRLIQGEHSTYEPFLTR